MPVGILRAIIHGRETHVLSGTSALKAARSTWTLRASLNEYCGAESIGLGERSEHVVEGENIAAAVVIAQAHLHVVSARSCCGKVERGDGCGADGG